MSVTHTETAQIAAQSVETSTDEETPAKIEIAVKAQNTGSKAGRRLSLSRKLMGIKNIVGCGIPNPLETVNLVAADTNQVETLKTVPQATPQEYGTAADADANFAALLSILNLFAVDWRIVSERATQKDANGSDIFCKPYSLTASRTSLWMYEATLELLLINADKPDETERSEIHAIGTSKSSPAAARSAALRGGLLSFFGSRFNAPKIAYNAAKPEDEEIPAAAQNGANSPKATAQGGGNEPRALSEAQLGRLYKKAEAAGYTKEQAVERVLEQYDKTNPALMTREEYDAMCAYYDSLRQPIGR